jgi:hypothetical protein
VAQRSNHVPRGTLSCHSAAGRLAIHALSSADLKVGLECAV